MVVVLVVGVFGLLIAALASSVIDQQALALLDRRAQLQAAQAVVSTSIETYYRETGATPTSLKELARLPSYKHLCGYLSAANVAALNQSGTVADRCAAGSTLAMDLVGFKSTPSPGLPGALSAGNIQFGRVAVFSSLKRNTSPDTFVATNTCGSGTFTDPSSWCGSELLGYWSLIETKDRYRANFTDAQRDASFTLRKVADAGMPSAISSGSSAALRALVSVPAGSAAGTSSSSCSGVFTLTGAIGTAVLDCSDLYNRFGNAVTLSRSGTTLTVSSPLNLLAADGSAVAPATATETL